MICSFRATQRPCAERSHRSGTALRSLTIATNINPTKPVFTVKKKARGSSDEISE